MSLYTVNMNNFIVSARKYRPDTFETVVGQKATTATLKNAISGSKLAQAYLFCGPRGVGKTTCARILAKTINCTQITPEIEACNQCDSCRNFNENRSYNIHELDAASNNSVDDIRNLIEQVRIPPQVGKYSVYIIDEVHMLSQSAFNAFLKTLEEPPPHVVFILATTEKHKILPTILSRCQIYDFNRIRIQDIVDYLKKISDKEGVTYEPDALNIIAEKADGAMRDALSVYDQMVSFSGGVITYKNVIENLNVLDYEYYFKSVAAIISSDVSTLLLLFNEILQKGFDGQNYILGLSNHFRQLLVSKYDNTLVLLEVGDNIRKKYQEQAQRCGNVFLYSALEICNECDINYRASKHQRLHVEITLIRLCNLNEKKNTSHEPEELILPVSDLPVKEKVKENETKEEDVADEVIIIPDKPDTDTPGNDLEESPPLESSTPSIKEALKKIGDTSEQTNDETEGENNISGDVDENKLPDEEPLSQEPLVFAWLQYAEKQKKDSPRIYSILKDQKIELTDQGNIKVYFNNKAQIEDFKNRVKKDLTAYLRDKLRNHTFEMDEILENDESKTNNLYTVEDKFKHMAEKNPALNKFKQQFNLDFE